MERDGSYRYLDLRPGPDAWPGAIASSVVYDEDDDCVRLAILPTPAVELVEHEPNDPEGNGYVVDREHRCLRVVRCDGSVEAYRCLGAPALVAPVAVALGPRQRLYVADAGDETMDGGRPPRIVVVDRATGTIVDEWAGIGVPADATADDAGWVYVLDALTGVVRRFDADGVQDLAYDGGFPSRPQGPVAGVAAPAQRSREGRLLLGPLPLVDGTDSWERIVVERAAAAGNVRCWTRISGSAAVPPLPPVLPPLGESRLRTAPDEWRACPLDAPDALVLHDPAPFLWICLDLSGDGLTGPAIRSLRVEQLGRGLPGRLPGVFAASDADETTYRLVQLIAAALDEVEAAIDDLPRHFDAAAAPEPSLAQLAGWLAHLDDPRRSTEARRETIAEAFARHGRRGTRAELERMLGEAAGIPIRISEPAAEVALWSLGEVLLGEQTMLIPSEAQGAVVGVTAEVDRSHLITDGDLGWPLHADVAHRFRVHVGATSLDGGVERELWSIIEREKPAHTLATLCLATTGVRVGNACIGPDLVLDDTCPTPTPAAARTEPRAVGEPIGVTSTGGRQ